MNKKGKQALILGITGSFGSGKTTCAKMFRESGAYVVDADRIYHRVIKPKSAVYKKIVSVFGKQILKPNGKISRKKLAKIVFAKRKDLQKLCRITHPPIIKEIRSKLLKLKKLKKPKIIVIDAPLLIEAGLTKMTDKLIVVKASKRNQITRAAKHKGLSRSEIIRRIRNQAPLAEKIKLADYVIDNNGTLGQIRKQVRNIWRQIYQSKDNNK